MPKLSKTIEKKQVSTSATRLPSTETLSLRVTNVDGLLAKDGVGYKLEQFDPNALIERAIKKMLKIYPVTQDWTQFGFFTSSHGWLDPARSFGSYGFSSDSSIEFKKRYGTYTVSMPGNLQVYYQFDARALGSDLLDILEHNFLNTGIIKGGGASSDYGLYVPGDADGEVDRRKTLSSLSSLLCQPLEYRKRLQQLTIFEAGRQETFQVDYLKSLSSITAQLCAKFDIPEFTDKHCSLQQLGIIGVPVSLTHSLLVQGIRAPATLILKVNRPQHASSSTVVDDPSLLVNIYDEPISEATIRYEKEGSAPVIMASTLNKLVAHLAHEEFSDLQYTRAFLLTYHSFTTPRILLSKLIERFNSRPDIPKKQQSVIKARVLNFLRKWVEDRVDEFQGELATQLVEFVRFQVMTTDSSALTKNTCEKIIKKFNSGTSKGPVGLKRRLDRDRSCRTSVYSGPTGSQASIFDMPEDQIAAQLTRIDFDIYLHLQPNEFLNQSWSKTNTQNLCPTIMEMITRFNAISMWVAFLIIEPPGFQMRAKRFEKIIYIAEELLKLNNFQTLMAFLGGVNNAAISRLKFTKDQLSKRATQKLEELEKLMNMEGSYKGYREALKNAQPPVIPYLGVYLSDLTFVEDGNPDFIDNLINFSKRQLIYDTISKIETYKVTPPEALTNLVINKNLLDIPLYEEQRLYADSLAREPRGATKAVP